MADKNRLDQAAEASVNSFFTNSEDNKPEQENKEYQEKSKPKRKSKKQVQREKDPDRLKGTPEEIKEESKEYTIENEKKSKQEPTVIPVTITEAPKQEPTVIKLVKSTDKAPQEPQTDTEPTQPIKSTPVEESRVYGANTKPQKAVMGFRAEVDKIELWKLYADASEQEISAMCTAAIDEYILNHELTADQKEIFDIKKQALEAEKRIKNRKRNS